MDRPQTQIKLAAYQAYLPEWLRILGQSPGVKDLFLLDLFAGPGAYRDGVAGSPVIAADAAIVVQTSLQQRGRPVRAHLRLVEKEVATRATLQAAMSRYDGLLDYRILDGTAEQRASELLSESSGAPTLALLDPDGIELPFDLVRQFGRRPRTELLLSFDVQALLRCAELDNGRAVTRFFGDDVAWRSCYGPSGELDADALLEVYRRKLADGQLFRYTSVHRIVFNPMHANRAIAQGCGSPKGTEKWLQAFRAAARTFDARIVEVAQQVDRRAALNRAIEQLRSLSGAQGLTYARIHQDLLRQNLTERDTHQVLLFLRERGVVGWSSRLHRDANPSPRFEFNAVFADGITWDGVERPGETPEVGVLARNRRLS